MGRVSFYASKKKSPLRARGWWNKVKDLPYHPTAEVLAMVGWNISHKDAMKRLWSKGDTKWPSN
jgi:hypothetical protein